MAYNNNSPRAEYTASASQTVFPFLFKIFTSSDIKVYQTPVGQDPDDVADLLTLTTDYTVTINGDAGGEITLVTGATNGDKLTLLRSLDITRNIEYQSQGDLTADTLNLDQEYQTYLIADREASLERVIKLSENAQGVDASLPTPVGDAYFKWSADALSIENDTTIPDAVTTSAANAAAAAASATQAQLYEWEAEAERLTADSYATEAEDTFVNLVTSDGDGTFTYTPTTDYSALHYKNKAAASASSIDLNLLSPRATTITPPTDADYTLTATENGYGRLVLVDGSWTATHNIIVDDTERSFIVDNSAGTYTATVKTSAGTGIPVLAGTKVWLLCDGTNVIESVSSVSSVSSVVVTKAGVTSITVDGTTLDMTTFLTPTAGLDYYFSKTAITATIQADTIGGFHYSLVPHAEAPTGNKTEADMVKLRGINEYSIWTLWDRPVCPDPRGKVKVGSRWYDIYLMDRDYGIRGYSAPTVHTGANIAAGVADTNLRQIPKIPLAYGGDGTVTYGKYTWFQACEVATATGNQNISYNEFGSIAYGVVEGVDSSAYGDNGTIFHIPQLMSKYGIEMATGTEWIWGADLANGYGTTTFAWANNTDTRGQIYATSNAPVAVLLGGDRTKGVSAGSRASAWSNYVWSSAWSIGSRFACDSLEHA